MNTVIYIVDTGTWSFFIKDSVSTYILDIIYVMISKYKCLIHFCRYCHAWLRWYDGTILISWRISGTLTCPQDLVCWPMLQSCCCRSLCCTASISLQCCSDPHLLGRYNKICYWKTFSVRMITGKRNKQW